MFDQAYSKIWIIVITLAVIAGGIFAWQYFGAPKEEVKTPEDRKQIEFHVRTNEDLSDTELIKISPSGKEEVVESSLSTLAEKLELGPNLFLLEFSFPQDSNYLYFKTALPDSGATGGSIYSYNISTREMKKLSAVSEYTKGHHSGSEIISPNGKLAITSQDPDIILDKPNEIKRLYLLDLGNDRVSLLAEVSLNETLNMCTPKSHCYNWNTGNYRWIDNNTIQYDVYSAIETEYEAKLGPGDPQPFYKFLATKTINIK